MPLLKTVWKDSTDDGELRIQINSTHKKIYKVFQNHDNILIKHCKIGHCDIFRSDYMLYFLYFCVQIVTHKGDN